jgi:hypothetical protein
MATFPAYVYDALESLRSPEVVAQILKSTSLLEDDLDFALALYFCGPGRHFPFIEIVCSQTPLNTKIKTLEAIPARKALKSRVQALAGLRRFQRIRNIVAHQILLRPSKIKTICDDTQIRSMLIHFPQRLDEEFQSTRRGLYHITRSKEWKPDSTSKKPAKLDQLYHQLYRMTNA